MRVTYGDEVHLFNGKKGIIKYITYNVYGIKLFNDYNININNNNNYNNNINSNNNNNNISVYKPSLTKSTSNPVSNKTLNNNYNNTTKKSKIKYDKKLNKNKRYRGSDFTKINANNYNNISNKKNKKYMPTLEINNNNNKQKSRIINKFNNNNNELTFININDIDYVITKNIKHNITVNDEIYLKPINNEYKNDTIIGTVKYVGTPYSNNNVYYGIDIQNIKYYNNSNNNSQLNNGYINGIKYFDISNVNIKSGLFVKINRIKLKKPITPVKDLINKSVSPKGVMLPPLALPLELNTSIPYGNTKKSIINLPSPVPSSTKNIGDDFDNELNILTANHIRELKPKLGISNESISSYDNNDAITSNKFIDNDNFLDINIDKHYGKLILTHQSSNDSINYEHKSNAVTFNDININKTKKSKKKRSINIKKSNKYRKSKSQKITPKKEKTQEKA